MPDHPMDELDRFWDARLTGNPTDGLLSDAGLGEAVRRFQTAEDVDRADVSFVNRLWGELVLDQTVLGPAPEAEVDDPAPPWIFRPVETTRRRPWAAAIAAAAAFVKNPPYHRPGAARRTKVATVSVGPRENISPRARTWRFSSMSSTT